MNAAFLTYGAADDVASHLITMPRQFTVEDLTAALANAMTRIDALQERVDRLERKISKN